MSNSLSDLYDTLNKKSMQAKNDAELNNYMRLKTRTLNSLLRTKSGLRPGTAEERIKEAEAKSRELLNVDKKQDIELKKKTAMILFILLSAEIVAAFTLVFLKGFRQIEIDDSMLDILLTSTLLQTAYMTTIIITYLFPKKR